MSAAAVALAPNARPWWLWPNVLSLDAPLIALVWQQGFAHSLGVELGWTPRLLLALCAWLAYSGDRILDGRRLHGPVDSARHEFARVHWRGLAWLWSIGFVLTAALALQLPRAELLGGLGMLLLVGGYFALHHHRTTRVGAGRFKECMAGTGFAAGTVYAVVMRTEISAGLLAMCAAWAGLCAVNCLMLAGWDRAEDRAMGQPSLARQWPQMERGIPWLVGLALSTAALATWLDPRWLMLTAAAAVSGIALLTLSRRGDSLAQPSRRVLVDASLLSPVLLLV